MSLNPNIVAPCMTARASWMFLILNYPSARTKLFDNTISEGFHDSPHCFFWGNRSLAPPSFTPADAMSLGPSELGRLAGQMILRMSADISVELERRTCLEELAVQL